MCRASGLEQRVVGTGGIGGFVVGARHLCGCAGSLAFGGDDFPYPKLGGDQRHLKKVALGDKTEVMRFVQQCGITHFKHQAAESYNIGGPTNEPTSTL